MIQNSNVDKGGVYQIDVFKSKNKEDEKLYFAAYDILEIQKIKKHNKVKDNEFKIIDPACGTGGFLTESFKVLKNNYEKSGTLTSKAKDFLSKKCYSV